MAKDITWFSCMQRHIEHFPPPLIKPAKQVIPCIYGGMVNNIAHLVIAIREITDALIQANIIIKQQAEEIKETK